MKEKRKPKLAMGFKEDEMILCSTCFLKKIEKTKAKYRSHLVISRSTVVAANGICDKCGKKFVTKESKKASTKILSLLGGVK